MFSSNPERDAREIRVIEQQRVFYPNSRTEASWGGVDDRVGSLERPPVGYERTVRREYKKTGIDMKFLIPALILGLAIASGALASDHMGSSIGDRISYGVNNLSDRFSGSVSWLSSFFIPRQAPLSERMMRKAKYGAYDAKNKLSNIGGRLVDTASDAQDRLWETKDRLWDSKDSMMDRARDLYDDYEHDLVRRPMRRLRRALPIKRWTFMTLFSMIPWVPLLLGALAFFGLRPLINEWRSRNVHDSDIRTRSGDVYSRGDMYRTTNSSSLSNRFLSVLALVLNKIGDFLFRTGRDIREADSFRNLKPAVSDYRSSDYSSSRPSDVTYRSDIHRPVDTTTHDFSRSSDLHRPVVDSSVHHSTLSSSSDLPRTSNVSYAPIISSHANSHPISSISTTDSLPSSTVPAAKLSSGVSSDVMEPRVSSSGVAWTVPPVEPIKTFHTVSVKPVDPALLEKYSSDGTLQKKDVSTFKSEGEQPRMLGH